MFPSLTLTLFGTLFVCSSASCSTYHSFVILLLLQEAKVLVFATLGNARLIDES